MLRCAAVWAIVLCAVFATGCSSGSGSSDNNNGSGGTTNPPATVALTQLSSDRFTNASSQHATEVEPGSFSFGSTIVTSFQVARISGGGGADIGYAVSNDAGLTWQSGLLPGITTFQGGGSSSAVSDTNPAYDPKHGVWLIASLPIAASGIQVAVSRSSDGGASWSNPILVAQGPDLDKDWLACDETSTSPHYGNCYMEWDDNGNQNQVYMSTSLDGGQTWLPKISISGATGLGGQPLVQPNGNVVVPFLTNSDGIASFMSTNGGASWTTPVSIAQAHVHTVAANLRSDALPSAQVDGAGNVYVVWQDCSFRANCSSNDLVMSTSADGGTWTAPARIPTDSTTSGADHFIPGVGIDPATAGSTAHLGLTYYYYPQANCTSSSCALYVGFISSTDGGATWSAVTPLAGPMSVTWLPNTDSGLMVGDYIATSFANGKAFGFFAVAKAKSGSTFDEGIYTTQTGMDAAAMKAVNSSAGERPVSQGAAGQAGTRLSHGPVRRR
jgi:hypothetical protein